MGKGVTKGKGGGNLIEKVKGGVYSESGTFCLSKRNTPGGLGFFFFFFFFHLF